MWGERAFTRECESVLLRMCGVRVWSGGHTRTCTRKWGARRVHETANSGRLGVDKCGHENARVYHRECTRWSYKHLGVMESHMPLRITYASKRHGAYAVCVTTEDVSARVALTPGENAGEGRMGMIAKN